MNEMSVVKQGNKYTVPYSQPFPLYIKIYIKPQNTNYVFNFFAKLILVMDLLG